MKKLSLILAIFSFIVFSPYAQFMPHSEQHDATSYSKIQTQDQYLTGIRVNTAAAKDLNKKAGSDISEAAFTGQIKTPKFTLVKTFKVVNSTLPPNLTSGGFGNKASPLA
ncbi:hypothetical protein LJB93_00100 [Desulfovibrio sp. OttesenSCG-928-F07]|nr:hypothetical protein [Desulfovibrio sp. OttesenSCG-928-F07]